MTVISSKSILSRETAQVALGRACSPSCRVLDAPPATFPTVTKADRRRARASWEVRQYPLGEEPMVDKRALDIPEAERAAHLAQISMLAWRLSGQPFPDYERSEIPGRVLCGVPPDAD